MGCSTSPDDPKGRVAASNTDGDPKAHAYVVWDTPSGKVLEDFDALTAEVGFDMAVIHAVFGTGPLSGIPRRSIEGTDISIEGTDISIGESERPETDTST